MDEDEEVSFTDPMSVNSFVYASTPDPRMLGYAYRI